MNEADFQTLIWEKGRELYRDMPWRNDTRPYYVLVSELMLQQTQVDRVVIKFNEFISRFPNIETLAEAPLSDILRVWQGLGYNRRAKYLHEAARMTVDVFGGILPDTSEELIRLPGVGTNTAGAILAYAFNKPALFIETNIRAVYIHHFFQGMEKVHDKEIVEKIKQTAPWGEGKEQPERRIHSAPGAMRKTVGLSYGPREFYWALMDYGSWLKRQGAVKVGQSRHYKKQSALKGSVREVRGEIIRLLAEGDITKARLMSRLVADKRFETALAGLLREGLVMRTGSKYHLTR